MKHTIDNAFNYLNTPRQIRSTIKYDYKDTVNFKVQIFVKAKAKESGFKASLSMFDKLSNFIKKVIGVK